MHVRQADHGDIPQIVELLLAMKRQSAYRTIPHDLVRVKATIRRCITSPQGYCGVVETGEGALGGVLLGVTDQLWWGPRRSASDIAYYSTAPGAGILLVRDFIDWAWKQRGVVEVLMGQTSGIEVAGVRYFFRAMGFEEAGGVFRLSRYDSLAATQEAVA